MKTTPSSQNETSSATSSAPAADRPATAANPELPRPRVVEDLEGETMVSEDALGNLPLPPEIVTPRLAQLETWDAPAMESGYRVPRQPAEDEASYPEIEAEEGLDEAEEELREVEEEKEQLIERDAEAEEVEEGEREA